MGRRRSGRKKMKKSATLGSQVGEPSKSATVQGEAKGSDEIKMRLRSGKTNQATETQEAVDVPRNQATETQEDVPAAPRSEVADSSKSGTEIVQYDSTQEETEDEDEEETEDEEEQETIAVTEMDMVDLYEKHTDEDMVAWYREDWQALYGHSFGNYQDITSLSSMLFTYVSPGRIPRLATLATTLQVYNIKVAPTQDDLNYPLDVYGVVAARDPVDRNRNLLFLRPRENSQILTEVDPFLHLIGPSRAIVFVDPVHFEIQLNVKGPTKSQDRPLMSRIFKYKDSYGGLHTPLYNDLCTVDLSFEKLRRTVQATILGVQVSQGPWPFEHGGRVAARTESSNAKVMLLGSRYPLLSDGHGYLDLSRRVVSVELQGWLHIFVWAYSPSLSCRGYEGLVSFTPKKSGISQGTCLVGDSRVDVTVAWSLLLEYKRDFLNDGRIDDA